MRWLLVAPAFLFREISGEGGDDNLTSDMFSSMQILLINFNILSHSTIDPHHYNIICKIKKDFSPVLFRLIVSTGTAKARFKTSLMKYEIICQQNRIWLCLIWFFCKAYFSEPRFIFNILRVFTV